jgi:2-oxo-3-hexenedioate decarboxylase
MSLSVDATAGRLLRALDEGTTTSLPSADAAALLGAEAAFTLEQAYGLALELRLRRIARGEQPLGFKIGFTNRSIWPRYGVDLPIWGTVWSSSLRQLASGEAAELERAGLCQPRIEPEVVFGFGADARPGMDARALAGCVAWAAHGFEIVDTHFEGWRFTAADTVADFGLHARLFVGTRLPTGGQLGSLRALAGMQLRLWCDGRLVDEGRATQVLDGPFEALRHLLDVLQATPGAPLPRAGDVVTTGTITDAWPIEAGQHWRSEVHGAPLRALELRVR